MTDHHDYDPFDPVVRADPYPWYAALREAAPVYFAETDDLFVVSRYEDVLAVLRQPTVFSSELGMGALMRGDVSPRFRRERTSDLDIAALRVLIATDPPDHTLLRRIVSRPFTPRAIDAIEPRIRAIAASCVDDLLAANEGGRADFVKHMTYHNMRRFGTPDAHDDSVVFDDWLTSACTAEPARRRQALARWVDAPRARAVHPREEHLLPLMVVAGGSDEPGTRVFSDEVLGARVSAYRFGGDG